ncbi:conserved exported hypothetical protein [Vibrio chagasii]|nr:conserved exported hypothetical protein [Vibrio chagasii]
MAQIFSFCDVAVAGLIGLNSSSALAEEAANANKDKRSFDAKDLVRMNCRFIGFR